jgi:integrase
LDKEALMPRPVRDTKLDRRTARERLKPRGKPYWREIDPGLHLGYRKGKHGRWVVRVYLGGQQYRVETIGTADDKADADGVAVLDWRQAQARARELHAGHARRQAGVSEEPDAPYTVKDALTDYLSWLEVHRKSALDARHRAVALIEPELGAVELSKLTAKRIRDWLEGQAKAGARLRTRKGKEQRHRDHDPGDPEGVRRRRASANRTFTILRAALNHAFREGKAASDAEWRKVKPFRDVDAARVRYLQLAECARIMNACPPEFRRLVEGALLTGMRYGELAALDAGDFSPDAGTVHVRTSKTGRGRHVVLTAEGEAFFAAITAGRASNAPMFPRADGGRWGASHQRRPLLTACRGARLDPPADFHSLRHTYASLSVMNGVPLMVVARNLGHADTRMVERHYGHLAQSYVREAIRAGVPSFGIKVESSVTPLQVSR